MYTNATGSNLNFSLYRGGSKSKRSRKRKSKRYRTKGGNSEHSWFRPKTNEKVEKVADKCVSSCLQRAEPFCKKTCLETAGNLFSAINNGYPSALIQDEHEDYTKLKKEHEVIKKKLAEAEDKYNNLMIVMKAVKS